MQIRQHRPNFVDVAQSVFVSEFRTTEELLNIPWIKEWQEKTDFYRYSLTRDFKLMAELENGYGWWVIGQCFIPDGQDYQDNDDCLDLPIWEPKYTPEQIEEQRVQAEASKNNFREYMDKLKKRSEEYRKKMQDPNFIGVKQ